jgi:ATP-dependent RNA helicase DeaD
MSTEINDMIIETVNDMVTEALSDPINQASGETFDQFGLPPEILKGVRDAGFVTPSPIQSLAIPLAMAGRDLLAQARTGTGKTAAFGLPAMSRLLLSGFKPSKSSGVKILVMAPTRELALQVSDELSKLGRNAGMSSVAVYGGQSSMRQVELINQGCPIVVATPGRLIDLLESGRLKKFEPSIVVLDEADEMLDTGFLEDIQKIFSMMPAERQSLMFSATMPPLIRKLANDILRDPEYIDITTEERIPKDIEQSFYVVEESERRDALIRLIDTEEPERAIVFCRTKIEVDELQTALAACNYNVKALHGDMDQSMRQEIIRRFRAGETRFMIATDVAARGLGVVGVTHVFNYHMPFHREAYIHRIGRTGRAGQKGKAMTLVTPSEYFKLKRIQDAVKANFQAREVPRVHAVQKKLDKLLMESIISQESTVDAVELLAQLETTMDVSQIACRLIGLLQASRKARGPQRIGFDDERLKRLIDRKRNGGAFGNQRPSYGQGRGRFDGPRSGDGGGYRGGNGGGYRGGNSGGGGGYRGGSNGGSSGGGYRGGNGGSSSGGYRGGNGGSSGGGYRGGNRDDARSSGSQAPRSYADRPQGDFKPKRPDTRA